jgi:tRNA pseudouridine38-40 synthase
VRIAIGIEYSGVAFAGWQRQGHALTIQQAVEEALAKVADHEVAVIAAGRTDAGVHAMQQVAHFDTSADRQMRSWLLGANSNLPSDVALRWAMPASEAFHARFRAIRRRYRYVIHCRLTHSPLYRDRVTWVHQELDVARMALAAAHLLGTHDFSSYRAQECQAKSPVKTVHELRVERRGEFIVLDIEADGFLHHMVRNIAGVLIAIGSGKQEPGWAKEVLDARNRALGGVTARPEGLYFVQPTYPDEFAIPRLTLPTGVW